MPPVHPYLNPHENPAFALHRLLALLPASSRDFGYREAQLAEAIHFHARRMNHSVGTCLDVVQSLLPTTPDAIHPPHQGLWNIRVMLQHEVQITHAMMGVYAALIDGFFARNPHLPRHSMPEPGWPFAPAHTPPTHVHDAGTRSAAHTFPHGGAQSGAAASAEAHANAPISAQATAELLAEYDKHYYFPLGRLLQQLPGDITNQPRITPEQGQMCLAVSQFAKEACDTLKTGLAAIDKLLTSVRDAACGIELPDLKGFFDYLHAECDFMHACQQDYSDAAGNILRVVS